MRMPRVFGVVAAEDASTLSFVVEAFENSAIVAMVWYFRSWVFFPQPKCLSQGDLSIGTCKVCFLCCKEETVIRVAVAVVAMRSSPRIEQEDGNS